MSGDKLKFRRVLLFNHGCLPPPTDAWLLNTAALFCNAFDSQRVSANTCSFHQAQQTATATTTSPITKTSVFKQRHVVHKPPVLVALSTHTCLVCYDVWRPRSRNNWSSGRLSPWRASRLLTLLLPNEIIIVATAERRSRQSAQTTPPRAPTSVPHWITRSLYLPLSLQASPSTTSLLDHPEGL